MFLLIPHSFQTSAINHAILFLSFIVTYYVYIVCCSNLQFISRYSNNNSRPKFLQSRIITTSFINLLIFVELQSRWFCHPNASPSPWSSSFNYSAKILPAIATLLYRFFDIHTHTHTHNLSSVCYCRSHIAVFLAPSSKFHFCKSICSTNRQHH